MHAHHADVAGCAVALATCSVDRLHTTACLTLGVIVMLLYCVQAEGWSGS